MTTFNKAIAGGLGPAATTILLTLDTRFGWNLGAEFWGAFLTIAFFLITFFVANSKAPVTNGNLRCVAWLAFALTAVLMLSGCSMLPYYSQLKAVSETGISTAIEDRSDFNDKKAEVYRVAAGDIARGAMLRVYSPEEQCAIDTLILRSTPTWCQDGDLKEAIDKLTDRLTVTPLN